MVDVGSNRRILHYIETKQRNGVKIMTKAKFKKAMKDAMTKYSFDVNCAAKMAMANYQESFKAIAAAKLAIISEEMGFA